MDEVVNAASASVGQIVGTFATFPLDVAKTKLQATRNGERSGARPGLLRAYSRPGILRMYLQKFPTKALQQGSSRFTYYFIYSFLKNRYMRLTKIRRLGYAANVVLGYLAALLNVVFMAPMEKVATRVLVADEKSDRVESLLSVVKDVYSRHGLYGFYFGWTSTFYSAANPAIQNTVFDQSRALLLSGRPKLGAVESFLLGAISKAAATILTYPAIRAKTLIQNSTPKKSEDVPSVSAIVFDVLARDGWTGLFRGIEPTLQKGVLQSAFMLMVREHVDHATRTLLRMAAR